MLFEATIAGTKFTAPTSLHRLVPRQRLHALLNQEPHAPLTMISAPAGYGKTSVLSEWVTTTHAHSSFAWLSLEEADNDKHRFWLCVLLAMQRCAPDIAQPLLEMWQEPHAPDSQKLLGLLINCLLDDPDARYLFILDDYHVITEPAIHQGVSYLVEHLPPQLRVIIATRVDPDLALHRLRVRGHLLEICAEHLQCTPEEARTFLNELTGLSITDEQVEELTRRTEGWFVGLQLIALSLQNQPFVSNVLTQASGNQRYILEYLTEEVLRQQPEHIQQFLLYTSLLDQFCAPLCNAIWQGCQNQSVMDLLERKHLFVVALDHQGMWYRYHHLFAEALRHHLRQIIPQEEIDAIYIKASQWYAEQEQMHTAVQYTAMGHDWSRVITYLEHFFRKMSWQPDEARMMQQWIEQTPPDVYYQHPRVGLFASWLCIMKADLQRSQIWLHRAEIALSHMEDGEVRQHLWVELLSLRAFSKGLRGHIDEVLTLYEQASQIPIENNHYVSALLKRTLMHAHLARGHIQTAVIVLQEVISSYTQAGAIGAAYSLMCATSSYQRQLGQLSQAEQTLQQLQLNEKLQPSPLKGIMYAQYAEILYERNQLEQALEFATHGLHQIEQTGILLFVDQAYVSQIHVFLALRQFESAAKALQSLQKIPIYAENPYAQAYTFADVQVRLWLLTGKPEQAEQWITQIQQGLPASTILAQERLAIAQARVFLAQGKHTEASQLLAYWLPQARKERRQAHVLTMSLLQAQASWNLQDEQKAMDALEEAVEIGEPEGFIRHFLDEGASLLPLLQHYQKDHAKPYVDVLLDAFRQEEGIKPIREPSPSVSGLIDPLSTREQEVLTLVAQGASNQDIAQALVIAPNTVKRHVQTILSKLGVRNRMQAMVQAQKLGLVDYPDTELDFNQV